MHIALLSTCAVSVPPKAYGGTELVTAELAKMLTRLGHEVTVFATGDSTPVGALRYRFDTPVWPPDELAELRHAAFAWREIGAGGIDIVHAHQAPSIALSVARSVPTILTVHHDRNPRLVEFYADFPDVELIAISKRQAELSPELGFASVVHHGLDPELYPCGGGTGGYCAFLGRFAEQKGPHVAIDAANAAGVPLRMGGAAHWPDRDYFDRQVRPRLARSGGRIEWLREVAHDAKVRLLQDARALLFPIDWEEPFGLVMIEAMLTGTPVIAFPCGSVTEIVEEGITGFVVRDADEMAQRLRQIGAFDRKRCRARAEERWSSMRMARDYERIYERIVGTTQEGRSRRTDSGVDLAPTGTE